MNAGAHPLFQVKSISDSPCLILWVWKHRCNRNHARDKENVFIIKLCIFMLTRKSLLLAEDINLFIFILINKFVSYSIDFINYNLHLYGDIITYIII